MRKLGCVLVTGGLGFMGSSFIRHVLDRFEVVNLDAMTYAARKGSVEKHDNYEFVKGSVCDSALLESLHKMYRFDAIVHFAAETHVDRSIKTPELFVETNVIGTVKILELVRKYPEIHLHLVSTDEVYGSLGEEGLFTEDSPYAPSSPYSASKAAADHLALSYHKTFASSVVVSHASNNFGPFQYPEKLIPVIIRKCLDRETIPVYGDGSNVREWLFVDDHSEAILQLLERGVSGRVYNVAGGEEVRNIDLVRMVIGEVERQTGADGLEDLITFVADRPGHDFRYGMCGARIEKEIGFKPQTELKSGLTQTIAWEIQRDPWQKSNLCDSSTTSINANA